MSPRPIAAALAALFAPLAPALAADASDAPVVIVTATRFDDTDRNAAANVTTITREDIARTPAGSLPDLLATRAGIDMRSLYGGLGADASVNLRGFGENGGLRTLTLVDGRRLDSLDFSSANWRSIPVESIERIEIVRGSGAVLHGDQAVAGVINIITHRDRGEAGEVSASAGSFDYRKFAANLSKYLGGHHIALNAEHVESDEYRHNNEHRSTAGSARLSRVIADGEAYAEIGASSLRFGLPGSLTALQYTHDRRAAETTDSWAKRENQFLRPGVRKLLTPTLEIAAELAYEESRNQSWISNWGSYRDVDVRNVAFTPRLRWTHGLAGLPSTTVIGVDWSDARLDQDRHLDPHAPRLNTVRLDRDGTGVYLHNTTRPVDSLAITLGARQQRYATHARDSVLTSDSDRTSTKTASELGLVWQATQVWKLFAKASTTFRYPVLDELTTFGGFALPPPKPESGRGADVGAEWRSGRHSVQVTVYDLKMRDEITWNNATFQNENMQKTRHRGIEVDSRWQLARDWRLDLAWTGKEAEFREGVNRGNTIPLVPTNRWTAMLSWDGGMIGNHALLANHVGQRHFGGDEANLRDKLPAYTTLDWQSRWQLAQWELALRIANLTDRKHATLAYDYGYGASYYPANPRAGYVTARYRF